MAPMIVAHPAAHYPQMPWTGGDGGPALQPVFINPSDYQQMLQNQQNRPGSVDSESSSSKNSSRRGSINQKFVPSVMQNKKMQLGKFRFLYLVLLPSILHPTLCFKLDLSPRKWTSFYCLIQLKLKKWLNKPIECEFLKRNTLENVVHPTDLLPILALADSRYVNTDTSCPLDTTLSTLVFKDPEFATVSYILCLA